MRELFYSVPRSVGDMWRSGDVEWHCRWFATDPWSQRPESRAAGNTGDGINNNTFYFI